MNLSLLVILPFITAIGILFSKGLKQVRTVTLIGSTLQFILAFVLLFSYWNLRTDRKSVV